MSTDARFNDYELLRSYALGGSEESFATLVKQYADLVYSAALRQTGELHSAEEIAQVVFIILARKAGELPKETVLPGWLWRTTRFVALNSMRKERHRRQTEQEAASFYRTETEAAWISLAPLLDEALGSLGEKDRNTVILRFFERKSLREIADGLGISEDAAQKRVSRALEKLRTKLLKRGVALSSSVMVGAIRSKAVEAAPAGLPASLTQSALHQAGSAASTANAVLRALAQARRRTLLRGAAAALVLVLALLPVRLYRPRAAGNPNQAGQTSSPLVGQIAPPATVLPNVAPGQIAPANLGRVRLVVLDAQTQLPIANAQLSAYWSTGSPYNTVTNLLTTDRTGQAPIEFEPNADKRWNLMVLIHKPGFVPKFVNWAAARGDLLEEMPAEYRVLLERGTVGGGLVMDQDAQPVPDVRVSIAGPDLVEATPGEREGLALAHSEITDAQGKWTCDHLPADSGSIQVTCSHPDYRSATFEATQADLGGAAALFRLQRGLVVAGTVTDADGQPLTGAIVIKGRRWWDPSASRPTDGQGQFRFGDIGPGELVLTARADGFIDRDLLVQPTGHEEHLRLVLAHAATLQGRIVDEQGNPIAHAGILAIGDDYGPGKHDWRTKTDTEGLFQWLSAPPGQTNYEISAWGYKKAERVLVPNGAEQKVILQRIPKSWAWRISGQVLDSTSHRPIDQFQVWTATTLRAHGPSGYSTPVGLAPVLRTTGTNGGFSFLQQTTGADSVQQLEIEIRADGYLAAKTAIPGPITNQVWVNMNLAPIATLSGMLLLPNGNAATGAVVMLAGRAPESVGHMHLPGEFDLELSSAPHTRTDGQGRFALPAKSISGFLLAASPDGFAQMDLQGTGPFPVVRLQPWGRIAGTLRVGHHLGADRNVTLNNDYEDLARPNPFLFARTATTDAEGRFTMENVPPGDWMLEPHHVPVQVRAGETTQVQLGGGGLSLIGRLVLTNASSADELTALTVGLNTKWFPIPTPRRDQFANFQEYAISKNRWQSQQLDFKKSLAGCRARQDSRSYSALLQPDGTFSIEEVLPGSYELSVGGNPLRFDPIELSRLSDTTIDVVVPEPEADKDATLDIGIVQIDLNQR